MAIYEITQDQIVAVHETMFGAHGLEERNDLQRLLRDHVHVIAPGTMVLAEEFGSFEESSRRIDLLAIDADANLVVVELKRTSTGGHMELQALRYAAMVSAMTFEQAADAHAAYRRLRGLDGDATRAILDFLQWDDVTEEDFGQSVRIVLVSADFSKELTTSVMWLNEHDLDIRCVRLKPYALAGRLLVDVQQVIPLPEAAEYIVKLKEKVQKEKNGGRKDYTRFDVTVNGDTHSNLPKRQAMFAFVKGLYDVGVTPSQIQDALRWRKKLWRIVEGEVDSEEFVKRAEVDSMAGGPAFAPHRWYVEDEELFVEQGRTYALTNQWGRMTEKALADMAKRFSHQPVTYCRSEEAPGGPPD